MNIKSEFSAYRSFREADEKVISSQHLISTRVINNYHTEALENSKVNAQEQKVLTLVNYVA